MVQMMLKNQIKNTGISIIQVPGGVSFAKPEDTEDKMVFVVFGIAGKDGEHLELLSKLLFSVQNKKM